MRSDAGVPAISEIRIDSMPPLYSKSRTLEPHLPGQPLKGVTFPCEMRVLSTRPILK